jgi:hypothetical protein
MPREGFLCSSHIAWLFEYTGGGAINDVKDSCFPSTHRDSAFTVAALHQWSHTEPPPLDTKCVVSAEEWINEVIQPNSAGGPLPCVSIMPESHLVVRMITPNLPFIRACYSSRSEESS